MRTAVALWLALWFVIDPQIGYVITAPAIVAMFAIGQTRKGN